MDESIVTINPEVASALAAGRPVVALESTIITHGMPYPDNVRTALSVESIVREAGAVPATIACIDGVPRVGLVKHDLETLGRAGKAAAKVSRRDLPFVIHAGRTGGTTVAATMFLAARAGIEVFATGGIGGVHRDASTTFDVSADLHELARTNVTVVCSGVKSILDIGATLEYLETLSVPVIGWGVEVLPAFYCRESEHAVDFRLDTAAEVAGVVRARRRIGLEGGVVIANPVPVPAAVDPTVMVGAIGTALRDAAASGVVGKAITPFLLERVATLTGDASLRANIALVEDNARVAAAIALALTYPAGGTGNE